MEDPIKSTKVEHQKNRYPYSSYISHKWSLCCKLVMCSMEPVSFIKFLMECNKDKNLIHLIRSYMSHKGLRFLL